jgi:hypothetical protein
MEFQVNCDAGEGESLRATALDDLITFVFNDFG